MSLSDVGKKADGTSAGNDSLANVDEEKALNTPTPGGSDLSLPPCETVAKPSLREQLVTFQCILLNTASTVTIVFMNKTILSDPQLRNCQILVAMWHFAATAIVLYIATLSPFRLFKAVRLPFRSMVPISAFFAGFLLLGNLSLALNTVGFYQLAKIMTTPSVVLLNFMLFRKTISGSMLLSVFSVCLGVALTNTKQALTNPVGALVAAAACIVTALYQIWIGKRINDLNVSAPQLLLNQAPVSVLILALFAPFVDKIPDINQISRPVLWTLFGSGVLASLLNLSQFLIIGRTSALTFNIVSNLKNVIILALSWYHESRIPTVQDSFGMVFAVGGAWAYAHFAQKQRR